MSARKTRLVDCNPDWRTYDGRDGSPDALAFDCPEGHEGCRVFVRVAMALDGTPAPPQSNGAQWQRTGNDFATLTLTPSIRSLGPTCFFHGFITNGQITFCGDSK